MRVQSLGFRVEDVVFSVQCLGLSQVRKRVWISEIGEGNFVVLASGRAGGNDV